MPAKSHAGPVDYHKFGFLTGVDAEPLPFRSPAGASTLAEAYPAFPTAGGSGPRTARCIRGTRNLGTILFGPSSCVNGQQQQHEQRAVIVRHDPVERAARSCVAAISSARRAPQEAAPPIAWVPGKSRALLACDGHATPSALLDESGAATAVVRLARQARRGRDDAQRITLAEMYGVTSADVAAAEEAEERQQQQQRSRRGSLQRSGDHPAPKCALALSLARGVQGRQRAMEVAATTFLPPIDEHSSASGQQRLSLRLSMSGTYSLGFQTPRADGGGVTPQGAEVVPARFSGEEPRARPVQRSTQRAAKKPTPLPHPPPVDATELPSITGSAAGGGPSPARGAVQDRERNRAMLRAALSDKAAQTLRSFGFVAEMKEVLAPRERLPVGAQYRHLHAMDAICEVRGIHNVTSSGGSDSEIGLGEDAADVAPVALQWHYLLRRDPVLAAARGPIPSAAATTTSGATATAVEKPKGSSNARPRHRSSVAGGKHASMGNGLETTSKSTCSPLNLPELAPGTQEADATAAAAAVPRPPGARAGIGEGDPFEGAAALRRVRAAESGGAREVGAEAFAHYLMHTRDPSLFTLNGEDSDAHLFPNFLMDDEQLDSGTTGTTGTDRTQQRFERGLLTRQLLRNRKLVDDRDNPALDWAAWRAAAAAAFRSSHRIEEVEAGELANRMQQQWRAQCAEAKVEHLRCFAADRMAKEALLPSTHSHPPREARAPSGPPSLSRDGKPPGPLAPRLPPTSSQRALLPASRNSV